jgi:hypothetical protein
MGALLSGTTCYFSRLIRHALAYSGPILTPNPQGESLESYNAEQTIIVYEPKRSTI